VEISCVEAELTAAVAVVVGAAEILAVTMVAGTAVGAVVPADAEAGLDDENKDSDSLLKYCFVLLLVLLALVPIADDADEDEDEEVSDSNAPDALEAVGASLISSFGLSLSFSSASGLICSSSRLALASPTLPIEYK
jgi:hypothetical protein